MVAIFSLNVLPSQKPISTLPVLVWSQDFPGDSTPGDLCGPPRSLLLALALTLGPVRATCSAAIPSSSLFYTLVLVRHGSRCFQVLQSWKYRILPSHLIEGWLVIEFWLAKTLSLEKCQDHCCFASILVVEMSEAIAVSYPPDLLDFISLGRVLFLFLSPHVPSMCLVLVLSSFIFPGTW